jgi:hypothetical protein
MSYDSLTNISIANQYKTVCIDREKLILKLWDLQHFSCVVHEGLIIGYR